MENLTSPSHDLVKALVRLRTDKRERESMGQVLICNRKMIDEIAQTHAPTLCMASRKGLMRGLSAQRMILTTQGIIKKISGLKTPEGIIATFPLPAMDLPKKLSRLLVLDRISNPGNLGTLLRTAVAFGWDGAFMLENSVDPFNDKALAAGKGAQFLLPLKIGSLEELLTLAQDHSLSLVAAEFEGKTPENVTFGHIALILGSEAHGVREELIERAQKVTIPMSGSMESLNVAVAGGILLYFFKKPFS